MKIALSFALAALTFCGCSSTPDHSTGNKAGGPGAPAVQTVHGEADETFNISQESTFLRQGERKAIVVSIYRTTNFNEEVTLKFGDLPKGLSVDNSSPVIKRDETAAHFALTASDDAPIGNFSIRVTGHPTKGADASNDFKITVDKR